MKFAKFTINQSTIYINTDKIVSVHPMPPGTQIYTDGGGFQQVDQRYEKVMEILGHPTNKEKKNGNKESVQDEEESFGL